MSRHKTYNDLDVPDDFVLPPDGNAARGQLLFKKHCAQCHTIRRDGMNPRGFTNGPSLYGIMGRTAGTNQRSGWSTISPALEACGILWTEKNMMAFLKNPRTFAGGAINMNFRGMDSWEDRIDLIYYLKRAGHEEWMLQDGTPHLQNKWWDRAGVDNTTSYWEKNATSKQLKPSQHLWRGFKQKIADARSSMMDSIGIDQSGHAPTEAEEFRQSSDVKVSRRVAQVENGVKAASMQQGFDDCRDMIAQGPVKPPPRSIHVGTSSRSASASASAKLNPATSFASFPVVTSCEEQDPAPPPHGERAPSGLIVFSDRQGLALSSAKAEPAQSTSPRVLADGGQLLNCGLVLYIERR